MFHQNAQHTGQSPYPGPTIPFLKWKFQTGGPIDASPAIGNGRIYVASEDGNLYALNLRGDLLWTFRTGQPFLFPSSPAIGSDGTVYLGSHIDCDNYFLCPKGILYAINPAGHLKWNLTFYNGGETATLTSPTIGPDGTIYVSQVGYHVIAVHPDGTLKWIVAAFGWVLDSPALAPDGTVYVGIDDPDAFGACGQCLMAINPDGTIKWTTGITGSIQGPSPTVGSDGTVYVSGGNGLFAINPDGTLKWEYSQGIFCSPSIGPDGTVYCSGYAFDQNGDLRWKVPTGQTSATIGSNGMVYFGANSAQGNLYDITPNGTLVWKFATGPITGSDPLAIGSGGTIYLGSADGNVYAIG
jgi:outer membrane protein assembly factor BamB